MDARALRAPEGGVMGGGAPSALHHKKEKEASSRGWLVPGWEGGKVGRTPQTTAQGPDITM